MAKSEFMSFTAQQNSVDLLYDDEDVMIASIDLFHIDNENEHNRNNCHISLDSAKKSLKTFKNKPIIYRFNSEYESLVTDVVEHARTDREAFNMRVAGHIPSDSRITFVERNNGKTYCNAEAVIQKKYMPKLVEILENNDGTMKVSIEIKAKGEKNPGTGIFNIESFILNAITLLGAGIKEGIEGSHLDVLKFSKQEMDDMNEVYVQFSQKKDTDIFDYIKNKFKKENTMTGLSTSDLMEKLWKSLGKFEYHDGDYSLKKYWIEEVYPDDKKIIVRDNETGDYYSMPYQTNKDNELTVDHDAKVEVEKGWHERPLNEERFALVFAKEDYGTGKAIKVDKSSEAVSDKAWGTVDKTELRHKVLEAKNYKTLVHDVYAQVEEGWEDSPSSKLKYPIMLIEGDTAVYSRYGLASALGYAKAEKNTSVVEKVEKLYENFENRRKGGECG